MTKISSRNLTANKKSLIIDQLWRAVTLLESKQEVKDFLHDILTRTEIEMLAKRLEIVKLLEEGDTYVLIKNKLNVSEATISKIQNWRDAFGKGYKMVIERLQEMESKKTPIPERRIVRGEVRQAGEFWKGAASETIRVYKKYSKRRSAKTPIL